MPVSRFSPSSLVGHKGWLVTTRKNSFASCWFSTQTSKKTIGLAHLRLYRIIQRQIRHIEKHVGQDGPVLLQQPLNLHRMGSSRIFQSVLTSTNTNKDASQNLDMIGKLFYHWERQDYQQMEDRLEEEEDSVDNFSSIIYDSMDDESDSEQEDDDSVSMVDELVDGSRPLSVESVRLQQLHQWMIAQPKNTARQKLLKERDNFENNSPVEVEETNDVELEYYDASIWTTPHLLSQAVTRAFRTAPNTTQASLTHWAIRVYGYLEQQIEMLPLMSVHEYETTTTDSTDSPIPPKTIRMTAMSKCVGQALPAPSEAGHSDGSSSLQSRYRFVYRIRMEHLPNEKDSSDTTRSEEEHDHTAVQLLGRSWIIQQALEAGDDPESRDEPIKVHAPYTGAVGKHPVLHAGQVFEYMSGCDLPIQPNGHGQMNGSFFFAHVPYGSPSASVGQVVAALADPKSFETFEVPVKPFRLQPRIQDDDDKESFE